MTKVLNLHVWKSDDILRKLSKICGRRNDMFLDILSLRRQAHKNIRETPGDVSLELSKVRAKLWESVTERLLIEEQSRRQSLGEEGSREVKDSEKKWN